MKAMRFKIDDGFIELILHPNRMYSLVREGKVKSMKEKVYER